MQLWLSFLYGGALVSAINYVSNHFNDPAMATIIAAAPIGILSVFFLQSGAITECYVRNYISTAFIHTIAASALYVMLTYANIRAKYALYTALALWFGLQLSKYYWLRCYYPSFLYP